MFGKLLTNQKIAHKIVKPYVYKALREGLKTHDNGKIQNLRGFGSLSLRIGVHCICFLLKIKYVIVSISQTGKEINQILPVKSTKGE